MFMIYFFPLTKKLYDLESEEGIFILRADLKALGFFNLKDNERFYRYFGQTLKLPQLIDLFNHVKLFTAMLTPVQYKLCH